MSAQSSKPSPIYLSGILTNLNNVRSASTCAKCMCFSFLEVFLLCYAMHYCLVWIYRVQVHVKSWYVVFTEAKRVSGEKKRIKRMHSEQKNLTGNCYIGTKPSECNDMPAWSRNIFIYSQNSEKSLVQLPLYSCLEQMSTNIRRLFENLHPLLQDWMRLI